MATRADNIVFGAGRLFLTPMDPVVAAASGRLYLGDAPSASLTLEREALTVCDASADQPLADLDLHTSRTLAMTLRDMSAVNVALLEGLPPRPASTRRCR